MIKGRSRLNSVIDGLKKRIEDIWVEVDKGSIEKIGVRYGGELYKIWPLGFDVEIDAARVISDPQVIFEVSIDNTSVETPPAPSSFSTTFVDLDVETPPDPALFDVNVEDSRVTVPPDPSFFSTNLSTLDIDEEPSEDRFNVSITDSRVV